MSLLVAARTLWVLSITMFAAALVGLRWGVQISVRLMPAAQRQFADPELLHSVWVSRSAFFFVICAFCGLMGIYCSLRASEANHR